MRIIYFNGFKLLTDPELFKFQKKQEKETAREKKAAYYKKLINRIKQTASRALKLNRLFENGLAYKAVGGKIDIHKSIGTLPRPKQVFTPSKYKYMGPYKPLINSRNMIPIHGNLNGMFNSTIKWMK